MKKSDAVRLTPYNYIKQLALGLRKINDKELISALVVNDKYINRQDVEELSKEEIERIIDNVSEIYMKQKRPNIVDEKYLKKGGKL